MPSLNPHPLIALMAEVDVRPLSGAALFNRGGLNSTFPAFAAATTEGIYEDLVSLLNGRGSEPSRDLTSEAQDSFTAAGGGGNFVLTFNSNDRIQIRSSAENWDLLPSADNAYFGLPVAGVSVLAGVTYEAPNEWTRGALYNKFLSFLPSVGGAFQVPQYEAVVQDMPIWFRELGVVADDDDNNVLDNIQTLDNDINDNVTRRIRWGITDDGHVYWAAPSVPGVANLTWVSTTLRDLLGFNGSEAVDAVTYPGVDLVIATNRPYHAMHPSRPLIQQLRSLEQENVARRLTSGAWSSNTVGSYGGWAISFYVDGPADSRDLHRHFMDKFLPRLPPGTAVNFYQEWGDSRRASPLPNSGAYGLLYTVEDDGYKGRLRLRLSGANGLERTLDWPGMYRRRAPVEMIFTDSENGQ